MDTKEKLKRAKQILEVWKTTEEMPDIVEIIIEALDHYVWELENFLKLDGSHLEGEPDIDRIEETINEGQNHGK